jgi:hypothetical protein
MTKHYGKRDPSSHRAPEQIRRMDRGYNAEPEHVATRELQNQARAMLMSEGKVAKGDGLDVHHVKPVRSGGTNARSNLQVQAEHLNRGWARQR